MIKLPPEIWVLIFARVLKNTSSPDQLRDLLLVSKEWLSALVTHHDILPLLPGNREKQLETYFTLYNLLPQNLLPQQKPVDLRKVINNYELGKIVKISPPSRLSYANPSQYIQLFFNFKPTSKPENLAQLYYAGAFACMISLHGVDYKIWKALAMMPEFSKINFRALHLFMTEMAKFTDHIKKNPTILFSLLKVMHTPFALLKHPTIDDIVRAQTIISQLFYRYKFNLKSDWLIESLIANNFLITYELNPVEIFSNLLAFSEEKQTTLWNIISDLANGGTPNDIPSEFSKIIDYVKAKIALHNQNADDANKENRMVPRSQSLKLASSPLPREVQRISASEERSSSPLPEMLQSFIDDISEFFGTPTRTPPRKVSSTSNPPSPPPSPTLAPMTHYSN